MTKTAYAPTREELYEAVWSEAMYRVAQRYGISGVALAKTCRRHDIPVPERGYWAKRAAGRAPGRPALPETSAKDATVPIQGKTDPKPPRDEQPEDPEVQEALAAYAPAQAIEVAATLKGANPIVRRTVKALRRLRPDSRGQVQVRGPGFVQLNVTKGSLERAARIANAFIRTCEAQGLIPGSRAVDADCSVQLQGESVTFAIFESVKREERTETAAERRRREEAPHVWAGVRQYEYHPTGRLTFRFDGFGDGLQMRWSDGKSQRLEDMLPEMVAGAVRLAVWRRQQREAREAERRVREEVQRLRREEQRQDEQEQRRCEELMRDAERWETASRLRSYVAAVERAAGDSGDRIAPDSPAAAWAYWADGVARALDPTCETALRPPVEEAFERARARVEGSGDHFHRWQP